MHATPLPMVYFNQSEQPITAVTYRPTNNEVRTYQPNKKQSLIIVLVFLAVILGLGLLISSGFVGQVWEKITGVKSRALAKNITCRFDKQGKIHYLTDELVSGVIEFVNSGHPALKLTSIDVTLVGEVVYTVRKQSGKTTSTETKQVVFLEEELFQYSIDGQNEFILLPGNHTWPFRVHLNDQLPPSIEKNNSNTPFVHYFIRVKIVTAESHTMNIQRVFPLVVLHYPSPSARPTRVENHTENRNGVRMRAIIQNNVVVAGSYFTCELEVYSPQQVLINSIRVTLSQQWKIDASGREGIILLTLDLGEIEVLPSRPFYKKFQLRVPHSVPVTCSFQFPYSPKHRLLIIDYSLLFFAELPGFVTNMGFRLPLVITNTNQTTASQELPLLID